MAQISRGLICRFKDKVAPLEVAVLNAFIEVLRDSLFISGHLEIRLVLSFLN